jgi:hypothetical protein
MESDPNAAYLRKTSCSFAIEWTSQRVSRIIRSNFHDTLLKSRRVGTAHRLSNQCHVSWRAVPALRKFLLNL